MRVPPHPYVAGTKRGPFVYTSGKVARDREGNAVGEGDIRAQVQQVFQNLEAVLEEGGRASRM